MIPVRLHTIALIVQAKHIGIDLIIDTITINSKVIHKQCMFIALIGKRYDGHNFAEQAMVLGAQALLVNHHLSLLNIPQLIVTDTHRALIQLATWIRSQVSSRIIAITGSSGKTSVKEMTTAILRGCGKIIATQDNLNNVIGVSITVLRLTHQDDFAVIELGISKIGEMLQLSKIVVADIAIVNNIYPAHLLGLKSLISIKKEKGKIFLGLSNLGHAIINEDNHAFSMWFSMLKRKSIYRFSLYKKKVDFFSSNIKYYNNGVHFILHTPCGTAPIFLSMFGIHNVANALAASALAFSAGASLPEIIFGLQHISAIPGRLAPIILNKGKLLLLDDTYNSNVGSMISAIRVLSTMPGYRILVISDMLELDVVHTTAYHSYIGKIIAKTNIDQVFTVGNISHVIIKIFKKGRHFHNKTQLISHLCNILYHNQQISILVKGSRNFQMEEIIYFIKDKFKCGGG